MYAARHGSKVITAHLLKVEGPNLLKDVDKVEIILLYHRRQYILHIMIQHEIHGYI